MQHAVAQESGRWGRGAAARDAGDQRVVEQRSTTHMGVISVTTCERSNYAKNETNFGSMYPTQCDLSSEN